MSDTKFATNQGIVTFAAFPTRAFQQKKGGTIKQSQIMVTHPQTQPMKDSGFTEPTAAIENVSHVYGGPLSRFCGVNMTYYESEPNTKLSLVISGQRDVWHYGPELIQPGAKVMIGPGCDVDKQFSKDSTPVGCYTAHPRVWHNTIEDLVATYNSNPDKFKATLRATAPFTLLPVLAAEQFGNIGAIDKLYEETMLELKKREEFTSALKAEQALVRSIYKKGDNPIKRVQNQYGLMLLYHVFGKALKPASPGKLLLVNISQ